MAALDFPVDPSAQTPENTYSPTSTPDASTNGVTYTWVEVGDSGYWTVTTIAGDVISVNGKSGVVILSATDVGAVSETNGGTFQNDVAVTATFTADTYDIDALEAVPLGIPI